MDLREGGIKMTVVSTRFSLRAEKGKRKKIVLKLIMVVPL